MSKATLKRIIPPATLKLSTVTQKNLRMSSPLIANIIASKHPIKTDLAPSLILSLWSLSAVKDINVNMAPIGFTITKIDVNAYTKKAKATMN